MDPRTWPWIFDVWIAFALLGIAGPVLRWRQRRRAEAWPPAQGRIDSAAINEAKWAGARNSSGMSVATLTYSYEAIGARYTGTYKREFGTNEESHDFIRDLDGKALTVQYDPTHPSRSAVLESSIETLLSSRPPASVSPLDVYRYRNPLPKWLTLLVPLFETLSLIGFALSLFVNLEALLSNSAPSSYFWALHVGVFVVFAPAVIVAQKRVGNTRRKDLWKVGLKGAPEWMKYVLYCVFAYGFVTGVPLWLRTFQHGGFGGVNDWLLFSSAWLDFYWLSFILLYAAKEQDRLAPRCVNGHAVRPGANFCDHCGQPVLRA